MSEFPVGDFVDAAPHLRRPFTPAAVKFKVQATWPGGALIVCYIDARLAIERLNLIIPHLWSDQYTATGGKQMWCHLTVDSITRHDVGEGEGKGLVSDALKRAAVKFGIGVSLYAVPKMIVNDDMLKRKTKGQREEVTLNDRGEAHVRKLYTDWLDKHGIEAFGQPLSHGDVEGAQGDHEADPAPVAEPTADEVRREAENLPPSVISDPAAKDLKRTGATDVPAPDVWFDDIEARMRALGFKGKDVRSGLSSIGVGDPGQVVWRRFFRDLPEDKRALFGMWLADEEAKGTPLEQEPA